MSFYRGPKVDFWNFTVFDPSSDSYEDSRRHAQDRWSVIDNRTGVRSMIDDRWLMIDRTEVRSIDRWSIVPVAITRRRTRRLTIGGWWSIEPMCYRGSINRSPIDSPGSDHRRWTRRLTIGGWSIEPRFDRSMIGDLGSDYS